MSNYLGIDLGTSSVKVLICDEDGKILVNKVKSYDVLIPQNGWHEQNPEHWLIAMKEAIADIHSDHAVYLKSVRSISVTGQMHGIVPVANDGTALHQAIIWSDQRNTDELEKLSTILSNEDWVKITGNRPNISFTLGKIMWFKNHYPHLYEKTHKFLFPKDFIRMKLTDVFATDYSDASAALMLDLKTKNWSDKIIDLTNLDMGKLPDIYEATQQSGSITDQASQQFNLPADIPVICGCGDAQAQAIGNGIVNDKEWLCTIGTSGQLFVSIDNLQIESTGRVHTLAHGYPDKWVLMGATLSAGNSFKWLAESIFDKKYDFNDLLDIAARAKPGSQSLLFLPYLYGERTPHMDEKAKGAFIGLTNEHSFAHMTRAVVEGVLFSLYQAFTIVEKTIGFKPDHLILTGGATQHPLWLIIAANIFNIPVAKRTSRGGGAYGAAMIAALGIGDFLKIEELSERWGLDKRTEVYHANPVIHQQYQQLFPIYQKTYGALKDIYHELDKS